MRTLKTLPIFLFVGILIGLSHPDPVNAQALDDDGGRFGIGAMVGEPTGLTIKSWNNERSAIAVGVASSIFTDDDEAVQVLADYQIHEWFGDDLEEERMAFYYGLGGRVIFTDDPTIGVRLPLGLTFLFTELPFELFLEGAPILDISPDVDLQANALAGIRIYF